MRRQMLVINVVLLVAAVGLALKLRADWRRANQRYQALAASATPAPGPHPAQRDPGAAPAADLDVITRGNLFSPDRSNELPKSAERKATPPEPVLVGTLNLGSGKLALLAEANTPAGAMPRQVHEGEVFAGYRLVSIRDNQVVVEYEGERKTVDLSIAARQVAPPPGVAAATSATSSASPPAVTTIQQIPASALPAGAKHDPNASGGTTAFGPGAGPTGVLIPGTTSLFGHKDNLPAGAIIGDRRKVVRQTPFGEQVWWELIKPEDKKPEERKPQ